MQTTGRSVDKMTVRSCKNLGEVTVKCRTHINTRSRYQDISLAISSQLAKKLNHWSRLQDVIQQIIMRSSQGMWIRLRALSVLRQHIWPALIYNFHDIQIRTDQMSNLYKLIQNEKSLYNQTSGFRFVQSIKLLTLRLHSLPCINKMKFIESCPTKKFQCDQKPDEE